MTSTPDSHSPSGVDQLEEALAHIDAEDAKYRRLRRLAAVFPILAFGLGLLAVWTLSNGLGGLAAERDAAVQHSSTTDSVVVVLARGAQDVVARSDSQFAAVARRVEDLTASTSDLRGAIVGVERANRDVSQALESQSTRASVEMGRVVEVLQEARESQTALQAEVIELRSTLFRIETQQLRVEHVDTIYFPEPVRIAMGEGEVVPQDCGTRCRLLIGAGGVVLGFILGSR